MKPEEAAAKAREKRARMEIKRNALLSACAESLLKDMEKLLDSDTGGVTASGVYEVTQLGNRASDLAYLNRNYPGWIWTVSPAPAFANHLWAVSITLTPDESKG